MAIEEERPEGVETGRSRARGRNGGNGGTRKRRRALATVTTYTPEDLLAALLELEAGDFSVRLPETADDETSQQIAEAFNRVAAMNQKMHNELNRVSRTVGREGESTDRAFVADVQGDWATLLGSVNSLITDLMQPTQEIARTLSEVALCDR
jgi:methyl-accepting chemotaxis protein